jgi:LytS/YehU family sensor histidine kinase
MVQQEIHLNRYFWFANICFWLAVHGLMTHLQFGAATAAGSELSWGRTWLLMSPWYLSWVGITTGIVVAIHNIDLIGGSRTQRIFKHVICMCVLLITYWAFCSSVGVLLRGGNFTQFWSAFIVTLFSSSQLDVLLYFGVFSAVLGFRFYNKSVHESIELKRVVYELTQEQLKTLRSQLNPHFLFNALNTIASLVRLKREKDAVFALSELSLMLRKILEHTNDADVKVKEEVAFINSYLAIQKIRFQDKLNTHINVQIDCLELKIPNMLLHPLVENAVQHGSQLESNQNPVCLEISRDKNELKLVMTNKVAEDDTHNGFGIGLNNTRERLSKMYTNFRLELKPLENGLFETLLAIPIGDRDA